MDPKRPPFPEDTAFFCIYPSSVTQNEEDLCRLRADCYSVVLPLAAGYVWQHEPFDLVITSACSCNVPPHDDSQIDDQPSVSSFDSPPHLHGKIKYGDNIEDEWFLVYLLFAISRRFSELCIRVWDTDGEFLLIEAAYNIPRWVKPENSWNRVFIKESALHILPLPSSPAEIYQLPLLPSISQSVQVLSSGNFITKADNSVQSVIQRRISGYGPNLKNNMHDAVCRVPLPIAQILKHEPQLVALAVNSFYYRDLDSMKVASQMKRFLPNGKEIQMVDVLVRMSRAMYAQLTQQVFQAPRCYPMPLLSDPHYSEAELGMKLTCGFEMMYWERASASDVQGYSDDAFKRDVGWQAFLASLQKTGYFRGLLEGSKEYRELMANAKESYRMTDLFTRVCVAMNAPIQRIASILELPHSVSDFLRSESIKSDDDSWLYDGEKDLEAAMHERQKEIDMYEVERASRKRTQQQYDGKAKSTKSNFHAEEVAKSMHDFINRISSYEGAELPSNREEIHISDEPVTIKMESFLKELESALGMSGADLQDNSDESAYEMDMSSSDEPDYDERGSDIGDYEVDDAILSTSSKQSMSQDTCRKQVFDDDRKRDAFMEEYSDVLEKEIGASSLGKSFVRGDSIQETSETQIVNEDTEELPPINIDMNLLQNLLESYSLQHGLPGPASNLLGAMGLDLPDNKDGT